MYDGKENPQITNKMLFDKLGNVDSKEVPDLNGVLRKVRRRYEDNTRYELWPANGAVAILLRMGSLDSEPDFDEIKKVISMWYKQNEK
jgi:hypothetical protein